jgi:pantothenate synthetase
MTEPSDLPRPRDYALQQELDSLRAQEREGHLTPAEQRRAEELERRLRSDEHEAEAHDRETRVRHETREQRARHRR